MTTDEERDARPEHASHELAAVDVVRGVGAQRPTARRALEPAEVVHEARDLERDVVGARGSDQLGALEAVVEDGESAFVVGIARRVEGAEQFVDTGESLRHPQHPSGRVAGLAKRRHRRNTACRALRSGR